MAEHGTREITIHPNGTAQVRKIRFMISSRRPGETIRAAWGPTGVVFAELTGEVIIEHPWPPAGVRYVSNGIRRGRPRNQPTVTDVPTHELSPKS